MAVFLFADDTRSFSNAASDGIPMGTYSNVLPSREDEAGGAFQSLLKVRNHGLL